MFVHDEAYYESRKPLEDLGRYGNIKRFIWDKDRRAFLDRTAKEWASVGIFYLCFFGILSSIFSLQMWITIAYITSFDKPFIEQSSLVARSAVQSRFLFDRPFIRFGYPGLGFIPATDGLYNSIPLIWLHENEDNENKQYYIDSIKNSLTEYNGANQNVSYNFNCSDNTKRHWNSMPCFFNTNLLGECAQENYGYSLPYRPCVYVRLNKRFDWYPIYYNKSSELPEEMPEDLKTQIKSSTKPHVWLSCDGVTNFDKEHIGIIQYLPERGFPVYYFPFTGQPEYLSPVVALTFKNVTRNRLITIECKAWALNIHNDKNTLHFQVLID